MTLMFLAITFVVVVFQTAFLLLSATGDGEGVGISLTMIKNCGFNPINILDIGANEGTWSTTIKKIFPSAQFFMIEANKEHYADLVKTRFPFEIALVGNDHRQVTFYKVRKFWTTGNSIYKENSQHYENAQEYLMNMTTVDRIVKRRKLKPFDLIKFDVQGAELEALQGSHQTIGAADAVITEASIMNYNQGSPSFFDVHSFMESHGFALFDLFDESRQSPSGILNQVDVVWVKKTSFLWGPNCTGFPIPTHFNQSRSVAGRKRHQAVIQHPIT